MNDTKENSAIKKPNAAPPPPPPPAMRQIKEGVEIVKKPGNLIQPK